MMEKALPRCLPRAADARQTQEEFEITSVRSRVTVLSLAQGLGCEFLPLSVLQFLDGPDIARAGRANRFLYRASLNDGMWTAARDRLWSGKVFVSPVAKAMPRAKDAYIESLVDSTRTWLGQEELTTFSWWFRFKQQAGEAWTAQDPWYRNEKAPTVEFKDDHSVLRHGDMSLPAAADMSWRFVPRTGVRTGPSGSFLRVSIGGREVPTYIVSRHPSNWGFLLESCWTLYTSWEMPPRDGPGSDRSLLDDKLRVTMDDQWEEAMSFNTGLSFEIYDLGGLGIGVGDDDDNDGSDADGGGLGQVHVVDVNLPPAIVPAEGEELEDESLEEDEHDEDSIESDDDTDDDLQ